MALASLMDSAVLDSFLQSSIPSSQMALHLQVSMDDLVASSSSRALLAFSQSSATSVGGVMLLDLVVAAMGEMVVGTPLEMPLPSQHHLGCSPGMRCPLVWGVPLACEVEV